jgi:hypothetical protein
MTLGDGAVVFTNLKGTTRVSFDEDFKEFVAVLNALV